MQLGNGSVFSSGANLWQIAYNSPSGGQNFVADHKPSGSFVNITSVPEPSTYALLIMSAAGALWWARRRVRRSNTGAVLCGFALLPLVPSGGLALITPVDTGVVPQAYQAINYVRGNLGLPAELASNAQADPLQASADDYWRVLSADKASELAFIGLTAGNVNTVGVFPLGQPQNAIDLIPPQTGFRYTGDGSTGNPYPGGINPLSGIDFGFTLRTGGSIWYSDFNLNIPLGGGDQMLSYFLPDLSGKSVWIQTANGLRLITFSSASFLLTWEDLPAGRSDLDYNDAIFLVTNVNPVPEPSTYALLIMSAAGALWRATRKRCDIAVTRRE
jgi:hypothetical protein